MAIPDYQTVMLPLLRLTADGKEHSLQEAIETLAGQFNLSADERKELLPSGRTLDGLRETTCCNLQNYCRGAT